MTVLIVETSKSLFALFETQLQAEKQRITDEIRRYPAPIPACDAQFNYLLEQRDRVRQELNHLYAISSEHAVSPAQLRNLVASSESLGKNVKSQLMASMMGE